MRARGSGQIDDLLPRPTAGPQGRRGSHRLDRERGERTLTGAAPPLGHRRLTSSSRLRDPRSGQAAWPIAGRVVRASLPRLNSPWAPRAVTASPAARRTWAELVAAFAVCPHATHRNTSAAADGPGVHDVALCAFLWNGPEGLSPSDPGCSAGRGEKRFGSYGRDRRYVRLRWVSPAGGQRLGRPRVRSFLRREEVGIVALGERTRSAGRRDHAEKGGELPEGRGRRGPPSGRGSGRLGSSRRWPPRRRRCRLLGRPLTGRPRPGWAACPGLLGNRART